MSLLKRLLFKHLPLAIFLTLAFTAISLSISKKISVGPVFLLFLACLSVYFSFRKIKRQAISSTQAEFDGLEEEINILSDAVKQDQKILDQMPARYDRITSLFTVSQKFGEFDDPDEIHSAIVKTASDIFPQADNVLLFLVNKERNSINLVKSFKREAEVIREKKGDIIDRWVLKHNQSLVIDDITKDFRFDYTKMTAVNERSENSFLVSPLSIGDNVIGLIRLESQKNSAFSLEDSRLLRSICDLGVIVLERANLFRHTEELAIKDPLTGLYLRDYFFIRFNEEIRRVNLTKSRMGVVMLDIDDFKRINDTYGHIVGDIVLRRLARVLREIVAETGNVIARYGGEEFIFYLVSADRAQTVEIAEKVRKAVENISVSFRRKKIGFTVSLGAIVYPDDDHDVFDLITKVDQLLYKAKREGKNRTCLLG